MTKAFTSARAVPYSSVVGGGVMLLNEKGACVAQLAIMAGDKERSDAVSDELMKRIEDGGKFDRYANIETVIRRNAMYHGATEDEIAAFLSGEKDFISWVIKKVEPTAVRDVMVERLRQQTVEGWTPDHDDEHVEGELASAAGCYAWISAQSESLRTAFNRPPPTWPAEWDEDWWKPTTPRRDLVKAAALILAEIERLDRAEGK